MKKGRYNPSRTSPRSSRRGCLCANTNRYSRKCCNGNMINQGIGNITNVAGEFNRDFSNDFNI